jgi:hypothetical protein
VIERTVVRGEVIVASRVPAFANGTIHVRLEEIPAADTAARVVDSVALPHVVHDAKGAETAVPFAIGGRATIDPACEYRVRVWVDRDSRGYEGSGDLYSDTAYPVLTRGAGDNVRVVLG